MSDHTAQNCTENKSNSVSSKKTVWTILKEGAAQSLSKVSGLSVDQIVPLLDEAKSDDSHFALALPKLKVRFFQKIYSYLLILSFLLFIILYFTEIST
jgi:hypothetical protein